MTRVFPVPGLAIISTALLELRMASACKRLGTTRLRSGGSGSQSMRIAEEPTRGWTTSGEREAVGWSGCG